MNEFNIEKSEKFALVFAVGLNKSEELNEPLKLNDNIWFLPSVPIQNNNFWQKSLGTLTTDKLGESNFCLVIKQHSDSPNILDTENNLLVKHVMDLFYCIIFQGIPMENDAYYLTGANINGKVDVREYSMPISIRKTCGKIYNKTYYAALSTVTPSTLKQAIIMSNAYHILRAESEYRRLRDGFHSLYRAIKEDYAAFRIHDYVRAIEALIKPQYGRIKRDFIHRSQTLAKACPEVPKLLTDIYNLRSASEHLDDWLKPLDGNDGIAMERLWQVENLALKSYTKLLINPSLLQIFKTDNDIECFWGLRDDEKQVKWNNPVDLRRFISINRGAGYIELGEVSSEMT